MNQINNAKGVLINAAIAVGLILTSLEAAAQTASLEEIIVTAERRSESLQDTPMSVTAFTGDMFQEGGITSMDDVALQTPNFKITTFNTAEPQLYLRGIGNTNDSAGADPAVAVFIDDVYIGRPSGGATDLYDLERIEVLRGPQGTLYGRNAAGGAINILSKKPQQQFEAKAGVTVGSDGLLNLRGYVNGAVSDTLAGKLTVNVRKRDGFAQNVTTGQELENDDTKSVRGQLFFTPSDSVDVLFGFDYTDISNNGSNRFLSKFDVAPIFPVQAFIDAQQASNASFGNDPRKSNTQLTQFNEKEIFGVQARVDVDIDWARLTSITAYRETDASWLQALVPNLSVQYGGTGLYEVNDGAVQKANQFSQEFRLASETESLSWVAGLFYFDENVDQIENFETFFVPGIVPAFISVGNVDFIQDANTQSIATFGQLTYGITDSIALTAGARYTDDEKSINNLGVNNVPSSPIGGIPLLDPGYNVNASESWSDTTLRATLDWDISDNHMLYATYSEGFKSGAFIGQQSSPILASTPIDPETSTNIELGARTQWFDNRFRLNLTYFDIDYENLQTFMLVDGTNLVADNANAETSGVEADFAIVFSDYFRLAGTYASLDAEFVDGANTGNDLPRAPESSWSLSPHLSIPLSSGAIVDISAGVYFTGEYHMEISNDPRGFQDEARVSDASVKYTPESSNWDVTLWGKNLGDELYVVHHINGNLGGATEIYAPPLTYGLSFNYKW